MAEGDTFSKEEIERVAEAVERLGSQAAAARELGMSERSIRRRLYRSDAPAPGMVITSISEKQDAITGEVLHRYIRQAPDPGERKVFQLPQGHVAKGVSALVDGDGKTVQQWIKTREDKDFDWVEVFKNAFAEYEGRSGYASPPLLPENDLLNLIPLADWHINLLCWWREVGESWDLKIAERTIGAAIESVIERAPSAGTAVVLGGGDLMHNDDNTNRTARSGNLLDADGRHTKGVEVAQRLTVRTIDKALRHNDNVIVRILKGNHDEYSSVAIAHFLSAWYRNEPRVTVDLDDSLYWYYRFGLVMLAATHGHTIKLSQLPQIMATRRPADWGATRFRYGHGFHVHHKEKLGTEGGGVYCESHQTPIPPDGYAYGAGYLSNRSVQVITYHKDRGEHGRVIESIPSHETATALKQAA